MNVPGLACDSSYVFITRDLSCVETVRAGSVSHDTAYPVIATDRSVIDTAYNFTAVTSLPEDTADIIIISAVDRSGIVAPEDDRVTCRFAGDAAGPLRIISACNCPVIGAVLDLAPGTAAGDAANTVPITLDRRFVDAVANDPALIAADTSAVRVFISRIDPRVLRAVLDIRFVTQTPADTALIVIRCTGHSHFTVYIGEMPALHIADNTARMPVARDRSFDREIRNAAARNLSEKTVRLVGCRDDKTCDRVSAAVKAPPERQV